MKQDRLEMVKMAQEFSISWAARECRVTRKTVRKWLIRYQENGVEGLNDLSRAPHHSPNKISSDLENWIVQLKISHPKWGAGAIKEHHEVPCSIRTIYWVFRDQEMLRS
jgi:transposase